MIFTRFKKDTLIGDGLKEYPTIAQKANMNFHPCIFHNHEPTKTLMDKTKINKKNNIKANKNKIKKNYEYIEAYKEKYKGQKRRIVNTDKKRRIEKDNITKKERENRKSYKKNTMNTKKTIPKYPKYSHKTQ